MRLSVLICSLASRREKLLALTAELKSQQTPDVEIISEVDDGSRTVGCKRNSLLQCATGDYICFVDDDDDVSPQYLRGLLYAMSGDPDCVAIHGQVLQPGKLPLAMLISRHYRITGVKHRMVNHLTPVKRTLAQAAGFADMTSGEDCDYSYKLKKLVTTETVADPALTSYIYRLDRNASATFHGESGLLYWNTFGGDFVFEADVSFKPAGMLNVSIGKYSFAVHRQGGKTRVRFLRDGGRVMVLANHMPFGEVTISDETTRISLAAAPGLKFLGITECVVRGRKVVARYVRKY